MPLTTNEMRIIDGTHEIRLQKIDRENYYTSFDDWTDENYTFMNYLYIKYGLSTEMTIEDFMYNRYTSVLRVRDRYMYRNE